MDLANPDKRPPTPLSAKVLMLAFVVIALSVALGRGDDAPVGAFFEKLGVTVLGVDLTSVLCVAGVLVAGVFVVRYVLSIGGTAEPSRRKRRAQAAARGRSV